MIAAVRAIESARPDALFNDPLAEVLAGKVALQAAKVRGEADSAQGRPGAILLSTPNF